MPRNADQVLPDPSDNTPRSGPACQSAGRASRAFLVCHYREADVAPTHVIDTMRARRWDGL